MRTRQTPRDKALVDRIVLERALQTLMPPSASQEDETRERQIEGPPPPSPPQGGATSQLASLDYHPSLRTSCFTLIKDVLNKSVRTELVEVQALWHKGFDKLSPNGNDLISVSLTFRGRTAC